MGLRTVEIHCFGDGHLKDNVRRITSTLWLGTQHCGLSDVTSDISEIRPRIKLYHCHPSNLSLVEVQGVATCAFGYLKRMNIKTKT